MTDLLERLERYYDAVPRAMARTEEIGPFTLFVSTGRWPYYARPRLGAADRFEIADVDRVRQRQRELGVPEAFEWVDEKTHGLLPIIQKSGLDVHECPLMILYWDEAPAAPAVSGARIRALTPDDTALAAATAVAVVAFDAGGAHVGDAGIAERSAIAARTAEADLARQRRRIADGRTITVVAEDDSGPIAVGSHQPVGDITEIVGVATLPVARRRGLAAAVTAALAADAGARGADIVFLSAGSEEVARIYERIGFHRVATACIAGS